MNKLVTLKFKPLQNAKNLIVHSEEKKLKIYIDAINTAPLYVFLKCNVFLLLDKVDDLLAGYFPKHIDQENKTRSC